MTINESITKCNGFWAQVGETNTTAQSVSKFYAQVRSKLRQKMYKSWEYILIIVEINHRLSYTSIEIYESLIISRSNEIFRIFGLYAETQKSKSYMSINRSY